jgi:TRAP-type C4-dicarboxylate transport system substrate-binding protein
MINLKQIIELFKEIKNLLIERQDERVNELDLAEFIEWINKLKSQYIDEEETEDLYKYIEDNIYHMVCFE